MMLLNFHALVFFGVTELAPVTGAVPSFDINLDLPPKRRWVDVAKHFSTELTAMHAALGPILEKHLGKEREAWLGVANFDSDYTGELQGIVDTVNNTAVSLESLKFINMLYELKSPTACSAVLWAMANGTMLHGRNMDYAFHFELPDGRMMNWPNVTFEATFHKAGQPIFKETSWPGQIGIHTAMRFNGWGFQQNTRANDWHLNLKAAQSGGQVYALAARRIMETTPHFKDAVQKLYATKFMAPQYFVLSGTHAFEGAVLTIDRMGENSSNSPPMQTVKNMSTGWHLVQTNDDLLKASLDVRRPMANRMLSGATQEIVSADHMMQFMHTSPLFWNQTVFSTVMVPGTGYYKTVLPSDPPGPIKRELFTKAPPLSLATAQSYPQVHRRSRFLSPRRHRPTDGTTQRLDDEVSFLQVSVNREL